MLPADCALQACRRLTTANQHPTDYNTHSNEYITRPVQAWGQPPNGLASLGAVRKLPWQLGVSCLERHEAQSVDELHVIGLQENAHFTKPERRSRSGRPTVVANGPPPNVVMARGRPGPPPKCLHAPSEAQKQRLQRAPRSAAASAELALANHS